MAKTALHQCIAAFIGPPPAHLAQSSFSLFFLSSRRSLAPRGVTSLNKADIEREPSTVWETTTVFCNYDPFPLARCFLLTKGRTANHTPPEAERNGFLLVYSIVRLASGKRPRLLSAVRFLLRVNKSTFMQERTSEAKASHPSAAVFLLLFALSFEKLS